jgi:hypothetical protein
VVSELERIADSIREIGDSSGRYQTVTHQAADSAKALAAALAGNSNRSAASAAAALQVAHGHAARAAGELMNFGSDAQAFADRLASGGVGSGSAGQGSANGGTRGGASETRTADPSGGQDSLGGDHVLSVEQVMNLITSINPNYNGDPYDIYSNNCGSCALATYQRVTGINASAIASASSLSMGEMEAATGRPQIPGTPEEIRQRLIAAGPGSCAVVGVDRAGTSGHWFNAYYDGSQVWCVDSQDRSVSPWPPDYSFPSHRITRWDSNI